MAVEPTGPSHPQFPLGAELHLPSQPWVLLSPVEDGVHCWNYRKWAQRAEKWQSGEPPGVWQVCAHHSAGTASPAPWVSVSSASSPSFSEGPLCPSEHGGAAVQHEPESQPELRRAACHTQGPPQSPWVLARFMALFFSQRSYHRAPLCQNDLPAFTPSSPPASECSPQPCGPPSLSMLPSITFLKSNHQVKKTLSVGSRLSLAVPSGRHWSFLCFSAPFHKSGVFFFKDNFSLPSIH